MVSMPPQKKTQAAIEKRTVLKMTFFDCFLVITEIPPLVELPNPLRLETRLLARRVLKELDE
jgi:hypothetical protein